MYELVVRSVVAKDNGTLMRLRPVTDSLTLVVQVCWLTYMLRTWGKSKMTGRTNRNQQAVPLFALYAPMCANQYLLAP
jgi:hypothetical protein